MKLFSSLKRLVKTSQGDHFRAKRWLQLSVMLAAGIEATVAVQTLNKTKHEDNKALARVTALLQRGQPLQFHKAY